MAKPQARRSRDWYSISVESVRRTLLLLFLVIAVIAAAFGYQQWQHRELAERAGQALSEAQDMTRRLENRADYNQLRREFWSAWEDLDAGREAFEQERYVEALNRANRSIAEFNGILGSAQEVVPGRGRFSAVQGSVEYRRGERGAWKKARPEDVLNPGDWVKTSTGGSATVRFADDSSYTLRANTLVHLTAQTDRFGESEQVADLAFGWVELSTKRSTSTVKTPRSRAQVNRSSEALVAYDREANRGRFAAFTGGMEVESESGQVQTLGALQQIVQDGDLLGREPASLPNKPQLLFPPPDRTFDVASGQIRLRWRPVPGAPAYALEVSRNRLFASKIIEDPRREQDSARLGLRGEGTFFWQVAALGADGKTRGPWSDPRSFRVVRPQASSADDSSPPPIRIDDIQTYGSMLIVSGQTEAGAILQLNDQDAQVLTDGSFSKTIQVSEEGFVFVTATATDAAGNTAREQRRVFIDSTY